MKKKKLLFLSLGIVLIALLIGGVLWYFSKKNSSEEDPEYLTYYIYYVENVGVVTTSSTDKGPHNEPENMLTKYTCKHPEACAQNHLGGSKKWFMYDGGEVLYFDASNGEGEYQSVGAVREKNIEIKFDNNFDKEKVSIVFFEYNNSKLYGVFGKDVKYDYRKFKVDTIYEDGCGDVDIVPSKLQKNISKYTLRVSFSENSLNDGFVTAIAISTKNNEETEKSDPIISYISNSKFESISSYIDVAGAYMIDIEEVGDYYKLFTDDEKALMLSKQKNPEILFGIDGYSYANGKNLYYIENDELMLFDGNNKTKIEISDSKEAKAIADKYLIYFDKNEYVNLYDIESKNTIITSKIKIEIPENSRPYFEDNTVIITIKDGYEQVVFDISKKSVSLIVVDWDET